MTRPYQMVEFDGHRIGLRLKVVVRDPLGFEHEFEIERVWLLVIIDVCTRAVLGYHLVLAREYAKVTPQLPTSQRCRGRTGDTIASLYDGGASI